MRTLPLLATAAAFALGIALVALPLSADAPAAPAAARGTPRLPAPGTAPRRVVHTQRSAAPAPQAAPAATAARPFAALSEAEKDQAREAYADGLRPRMQADTAEALRRLSVQVDLDAEQQDALTELVHAEIDGIIDITLDAADGVTTGELVVELTAMFDATDAQAAQILDDEQLAAFVALRRRG